MKIRECDDLKLGLVIKRLPLISLQLGHVNVRGTVKDYVSPINAGVETELIYDLFTKGTTEIIDKWFDGDEKAADLLMKLSNLQDPLTEDES